MEQDQVYRVLLELKETTGKTAASLEDIKINLAKHMVKVETLEEKHSILDNSHTNLKTKVLWVSGGVGTIFGAIAAWIKLEWTKLIG